MINMAELTRSIEHLHDKHRANEEGRAARPRRDLVPREHLAQRPFNPMGHAGAIATAPLIKGASAEAGVATCVERLSRAAGRPWRVDNNLCASESYTGHRNQAIAGQVGLAMCSPRLDARGNSVRGIPVCADLSDEFGLHAFDLTNFGSSLLRTV